MIKAILLDLDDTLYDERDYVLSGFRAVAAEVARRFPQVAEGRFLEAMVGELDAHGRGKVFDRALARAELPADLVPELVQLYREHTPRISLWPGVAEALAELRRDHRLAVVTDGLGLMQRRKVAALGVEPLVDEVLYCWEHDSPKPDPAPYAEALRRLGAGPEEAVVIGDNPGHDMAAARALGCRSIRVLSRRFAAVADPPADAAVARFVDVPDALRRLA
jgi:putative hydrolase of the HAD superfamily